MAFESGPLSTLGITPGFVNNLAQQTAATGVTQALGQVWQGSGQSFFGQAGQALAGNLASSAVNVAINSALGTQISGPGGFPINTGGNFLASTVTPFVTSSVAAGINQNIQQSLQSAGPFGTVLSGVATGLVNRAFGALTGGIANLGGVGTQGRNYLTFPGGGIEASYSSSGEISITKVEEPDADYGGSAYTLKDVLFSLQPANQGPQLAGDAQATNSSTTGTTLANTEYTSMPPTAENPLVNSLKDASMGSIGKPGEVLIGSYTGLSGSGYDIYKVPGSVGSDENIGGYADPLGPLRGTEWDDLRPQTREKPLW